MENKLINRKRYILSLIFLMVGVIFTLYVFWSLFFSGGRVGMIRLRLELLFAVLGPLLIYTSARDIYYLRNPQAVITTKKRFIYGQMGIFLGLVFLIIGIFSLFFLSSGGGEMAGIGLVIFGPIVLALIFSGIYFIYSGFTDLKKVHKSQDESAKGTDDE